MRKLDKSQATRDEYRAKLSEHLKPGDTIYTILRHCSTSGMSRAIDCFTFERGEDGTLDKSWLSYWIAGATGTPFSERYDALMVSGAGMDMGFHVVYYLSYVLWPDGFDCTGEHCPSSDHSNGMARPHSFPSEWQGRPVPVDALCPVWDAREQRGDICGLPIGQHPTMPRHHSDGGYALRHQWI